MSRPRQFPIRPATRRPGFSAEVRIPRAPPAANLAADQGAPAVPPSIVIASENAYYWGAGLEPPVVDPPFVPLQTTTIILDPDNTITTSQPVRVDVLVLDAPPGGKIAFFPTFVEVGTSSAMPTTFISGPMLSLLFEPNLFYRTGTFTISAQVDGQDVGSVECIVVKL